MKKIGLSACITVHNEEDRLEKCLDKLGFAQEIIVALDRCTDSSEDIALKYGATIISGSWDKEGDRRNDAISKCNEEWVLEIDADEHVSPELASEIMEVISATKFDWHEIPVDNYIGDRLVRHGWGAYFGKSAYPGLFRNGVKKWGRQRVHPELTWTGSKGPMLNGRVKHFVDRNISDMIRRLDSYTSARARDIREQNEPGSYLQNIRRIFSRFIKCYIGRKGYKEGGYGLLIALLAALYPIISYIKARNEDS